MIHKLPDDDEILKEAMDFFGFKAGRNLSEEEARNVRAFCWGRRQSVDEAKSRRERLDPKPPPFRAALDAIRRPKA